MWFATNEVSLGMSEQYSGFDDTQSMIYPMKDLGCSTEKLIRITRWEDSAKEFYVPIPLQGDNFFNSGKWLHIIGSLSRLNSPAFIHNYRELFRK